MSKYGEIHTFLREEKYLVEALKEMGYEVEVHPEGVHLNSYYEEQEAKVANIIIRRQHLRGAYGDIGFTRQPDGQLAVIKVFSRNATGCRACLWAQCEPPSPVVTAIGYRSTSGNGSRGQADPRPHQHQTPHCGAQQYYPLPILRGRGARPQRR